MSLPALPAAFHDIAKRVNNWGRWGPTTRSAP